MIHIIAILFELAKTQQNFPQLLIISTTLIFCSFLTPRSLSANVEVSVLHCPGHTQFHIVYLMWFKAMMYSS